MLKCKIMRFTAEEEEAIRRQLSDILASQAFEGSALGHRLLSHVVTETIAGRLVKEETIRAALYPKSPPDSAVVRTAAIDLRKRLKRFYQDENTKRGVQITVPKNTYVPDFDFQLHAPPPPPPPPPPAPPSPPRRDKIVRVLVGLAIVVIALAGVDTLLESRHVITFPSRGWIGQVFGQVDESEPVFVKEDQLPVTQHRYLVVAPAKDALSYRQNTLTLARFGDSRTPAGTRFQICVLSTSTELAIGQIGDIPADAVNSGCRTVTRR